MELLMTRLRDASKGLHYVSESDFPFQPVHWPKEVAGGKPIEAAHVRSLAGLASEAPAATQDFEKFFEPLVTMEEWYEEEDRQLVSRYQRLKETLEELLTDITVLKFGRVQKEVFVLGRTDDGGIAGLRTKAVET